MRRIYTAVLCATLLGLSACGLEGEQLPVQEPPASATAALSSGDAAPTGASGAAGARGSENVSATSDDCPGGYGGCFQECIGDGYTPANCSRFCRAICGS